MKKESKWNWLILISISFIFFVSIQSAYAVTITWDASSHDVRDGNVDPSLTPTTSQFTISDPTLIGKGTIVVTVNSTSFPQGIMLKLTEDPSIPGSFTNTNLIFTNGTGTFGIPSTQTIGIHMQSLAGTGKIISCPLCINGIIVYSTTDKTGISMNLTETSPGVFTNSLRFTSGPSINGSAISVHPGDVVSIRDLNLLNNHNVENELALPNLDPAFGAVPAKINDFVCAVYGVDKACTKLDAFTEPGGGGGGLIQPTVVIDAILGAIGGSSYIVQPPSFGGANYNFSDGLTLTQGNNKTVFDISQYNQEIPKQVMVAGVPVDMTFKTFESYYSEGVVHMGLYLIPRGQDMITPNSIAYIELDKGQPVKVNDPNHILSNATASCNSDGTFQHTKFSFIPTKSYNKMSFLVRAWNDHMYTTDARVHDAVEIPIPPKTLPAGVIKYDNFADLQSALYKDQFIKPEIMSHIHDTNAVFSDSQGKVYWLYDTVGHFVTLVVSDENDNELFSFKSPLQPYAIEKKGDYKFMYFTIQQLNGWNVDQIKKAMKVEEEKAMATAVEMKIMPHSNW